jgi:hypothetical protein
MAAWRMNLKKLSKKHRTRRPDRDAKRRVKLPSRGPIDFRPRRQGAAVRGTCLSGRFSPGKTLATSTSRLRISSVVFDRSLTQSVLVRKGAEALMVKCC